MTMNINDSQILSATIKKARYKKHLTQADCAKLLGHSLSFQKDLERGRFSPSLDNFYHICRSLNFSADACIFHNQDTAAYKELIRLLSKCEEKHIRVLTATAYALLEDYDGCIT